MPPSTPLSLTGLAPGGDTSNSKKSLSQLKRLRDIKRKTLTHLFEEKKKIIIRMKAMNEELFVLDNAIEALEEQQYRQIQTRRITPQLNTSLVQVKPEPGLSNDNVGRNPNSPSRQDLPLTMNPDEVLTEPSQTTPARGRRDDEILTDPLTWTQVEGSTSETAVPQHQNQIQSTSPEGDYFYDSGDDIAYGPPVHDGSIIEKKNSSSTNDNSSNSNNDNNSMNYTNDTNSMKFGTADGAQSAGSNPQRTTRTIDNFFSPRQTSNVRSNQKETLVSNSAASSCPYSRHDIYQTLRQSFRLQDFRENQFEIIQSTLSGKDNFVLMKTGGGKSLLYQLPAVLESPKITVVVSPLLSLIQDQEEQMNGFVRDSCLSFTSGMGAGQHNENWRRVRDVDGGIIMILVTPERVFKSGKLKSELQSLDEQNRLGRFVIDECHCACQWGHDFRPDYAKLRVLRQHFPDVPILAVTATASEQVRKDCIKIFQLSPDHAFFRSTADRPNLTYQVRPKESNVIQDMAGFIKGKHPRSAGIVYTYSRKDADTVASELCEQGIIAESYHSDVSPNRKKAIHQSWMRNRTQVVVATIAFGLGINKPDVRFVLHHTLSKTLESYYQESGRAGRDGNPSDCVLYYSAKDVPRMLKMIHGDSTEHLFLTMVKYAQQFGNDQACRALILQNMGEPNQNSEQFHGLNEMVEMRDVTSHAITLVKLLMHFQNKNVTMNMLISEWRKSPAAAIECVKNNPPGKDLTKEDSERMIIGMLVNGLIEPIYRFTAYSTVVYLQCTQLARRFIVSSKANMKLPLPKAVPKKRKTNPLTTPTDKDGWIETNATKQKRKSAASVSKSSTKKSGTKTNGTKTVAKKKTLSKRKRPTKATKPRSKKVASEKDNEVIELIEDSDATDSENLDTDTHSSKVRPRRRSAAYASSRSRDQIDHSDDESISEYEFE